MGGRRGGEGREGAREPSRVDEGLRAGGEWATVESPSSEKVVWSAGSPGKSGKDWRFRSSILLSTREGVSGWNTVGLYGSVMVYE